MTEKSEIKETIISFDDSTFATKEELNEEASSRATNDNLILNNLNSYRNTTNTKLDTKQNSTDSALQTDNQTIAGAINEININVNNQTTTINSLQNQVTTNSDEITNLQNQTETNANNTNKQLDTKQNSTDSSLETNDQTIVGAINELNNKKTNTNDFSIFKDTMLQFQDFTNDALDTKQNSTDSALQTDNQTISGAINEININVNNQTTTINSLQSQVTKTNDNLKTLKEQVAINTTNITNSTNTINQITDTILIWNAVGKSINNKTWNYNLIINKTYRITYNWSTNDATSKIYKEFVWTGNTISLETYIDNFSGVTLLGITVLGSADIVALIAESTGVQIITKFGISSIGKIINLEQAS